LIIEKKRAMVQKAKVSRGKAKMDKMVRRRELPCGRQSVLLYRERVALGVVLVNGKKKRDEKVILYGQRRGLNPGQVNFYL
jgi:hypothetical protein